MKPKIYTWTELRRVVRQLTTDQVRIITYNTSDGLIDNIAEFKISDCFISRGRFAAFVINFTDISKPLTVEPVE